MIHSAIGGSLSRRCRWQWGGVGSGDRTTVDRNNLGDREAEALTNRSVGVGT